MTEEELDVIRGYDRGEILYLKMEEDGQDYSDLPNPVGMGFPYPLFFADADEEYLTGIVGTINNQANTLTACLASCEEECHVQEIRVSPTVSRILVDNEEYYYNVPEIRTGRAIKSVTDITKVSRYQVRVKGDALRTLTPLRGAAILEVEFEQSPEQQSDR